MFYSLSHKAKLLHKMQSFAARAVQISAHSGSHTQVMVIPWALWWFLSARRHYKYRLCHVPVPWAHGHQWVFVSSFVQKINPSFPAWSQRVLCFTSSARGEFCLLRSLSLGFIVTKRFAHHLLSIYSLHPIYYKMSQRFSASFGTI